VLLGLASLLTPAAAHATLGDGGPLHVRPLDPGTPSNGQAQPTGAPSPPSPEQQLEPEPGAQAPGGIPLFPRLPIGRAAGMILPPEPQPDDRMAQAEAELEEYLNDAIGRDRANAGASDGWYHDAGRAMFDTFRPNREEIEGERRRGMNVVQLVMDELGRYARGPERPIDVPGQPVGADRAAVPGTPLFRELEAQDQEMLDRQNLLNGSVTWQRTELRVTHNPEGDVAGAWVIRSSGSHSLDEAALRAARTAQVPMPPPERIMGDRQAIQSDWAFEMGDVATDPTQAGCVEDPHGGPQCAAFGRGIVRLRVYLLRVVSDEQSPSTEERRARRHRERTTPSP